MGEYQIGELLSKFAEKPNEKEPLQQFYYHNRDQHGNTLFVLNASGKAYLKLATESKTRDIGWIETPDGIHYDYCKNEKEAETFRKNDSWSINHAMLMLVNRYIYFRSEKGTYRIKKEKALQVGSFLWFADAGMERKFYVEKKHWQFAPKKK